jgi:hypothetical protein
MDYDDECDELNMDWEHEYIRTIDSNVTYTPEPMTQIRVKLLYVNVYSQIQHSVTHQYPLTLSDEHSGSELSETTLMQIIYSHKNYQNKHYKCDSISHFILSIEPSLLFKDLSNHDFYINYKPFFSSFHIPQTINIPNCSFIFHSINTIWIIFKEIILINPPIPVTTYKRSCPKKTKRVRISNEPNIVIVDKTRKHTHH